MKREFHFWRENRFWVEMELGQCQARLLGHPPQQSSTTTPETSRGEDIDPRFAHLLRLGAAYHRLRRFIASEMGRHSSGLYVRAFCRELAIIADEYGRDVLGLGDQPGRRPPAPELELRMSRVRDTVWARLCRLLLY